MSYLDEIMDSEKESKSTLPLWVHYLLRIILQIAVGYGAYVTWGMGGIFKLISVLLCLIFLYLILIIFFLEDLKDFVREEMSRR